jgi:hypothetical protein
VAVSVQFQLISLKRLAEFTLLQTPQYKGKESLAIYVPGELLQTRLVFEKPVTLYVSPHNPGARAFASELEEMHGGISTESFPTNAKVGGDEVWNGEDATHFLLYLNSATFMDAAGERLAEELRTARAAGVPIVMAHEKAPDLGGCDFSLFFTTTPPVRHRTGVIATCPTLGAH